MKYPIYSSVMIDVTKAPYCADNTGHSDCTKILKQVFDDVLKREIEGVRESYELLMDMSDNGKHTVYDGFENRVYDSSKIEVGTNVLYPRIVPPAKIIYFPKGTYLVSDTVTYSYDNLKNIYLSKPLSELCRNIHVMGESPENTVIKLADNCEGFEQDTDKPVISFVNVSDCMHRKCSNVCQNNTIEDITIDCGLGNKGAVGLRFLSINTGRISNVNVRSEHSRYGIQTSVNTTASIVDVKISGFDYGMHIPHSSIAVLDRVDVSANKVAGIKSDSSKLACKKVDSGEIPTIEFYKDEWNKFEELGVYYFADKGMTYSGHIGSNKVYYEKEDINYAERCVPINHRSTDAEDWVCVDDYGAVPDGKTDCTASIQAAFNSGKSIIIFGSGHYFVNDEITVPATVKTIDFMYSDFFSGEKLVNNKDGALFHINEESEDIIFIENLYTFEQFYGYMRLIKHAAKRDMVLRNIHTQAASTYFNTVGGSKVWIDNSAATTATYAHNCVLTKDIAYDDYSYVIPYEFHGQKVYAMQFNPERAHIEILNDNSELLIDAFKIEGPGIAVKNINGGKTKINICLAAIGYIYADNALYYISDDSQLDLTGMIIRDSPSWEKLRYLHLMDMEAGKDIVRIPVSAIEDINDNDKRINCFESLNGGKLS